MKIKLALLEKDENYLNRIVAVFGTKYADKLELYSFTDKTMALSCLESERIDVFIAYDIFEIDMNSIPKRCGFAYFVDYPEVNTVRKQRAICKFQKADLIYKQILGIYAEVSGSISDLRLVDDECKIVVFASPCGGSGNSCMAAAYSVYLATNGKKTLYLNLERFGSSESFFAGEGQFDMSDIVFALKSRTVNLSVKMESCVRKDSTGVCFYSSPKVALDIMELNSEEIIQLISVAKSSGSYDRIVLDMDFGMDETALRILNSAYAVIWVGDGSDISNSKISRAYQALKIKEQNEDLSVTGRIMIVYNKFSNKNGKIIEETEVKNIGGAPNYENASARQVVAQLSRMKIFDKID